VHAGARRQDGLRLHGAAGAARDDARTALQQAAGARPRHRDRTAGGAAAEVTDISSKRILDPELPNRLPVVKVFRVQN